MVNADGRDARSEREQCSGKLGQLAANSGSNDKDIRADPSEGYWRDADWLFSRDGKWRPVEVGTFPLAHADPARMGRLRAYGNALDLAQATGFIRAYLERDVGRETIVADSLFEWGM